MAKKKLTTEQRIENYKRKRRVILCVKIMIAVLIAAAMIPITYYGYYYVVFTVLAQNDYDPDKAVGPGYSKPLHMMHDDGEGSTFVLAYYYDDCWHVIDDTQKLRENRDNFIIYKEDNQWHEGTHLQLMLIKDTYMYHNIP